MIFNDSISILLEKFKQINANIDKLEIKNNYNLIKPVIKWVGGKTQIIDIIINKFPKKINDYHEIFLGGGSVLFELLYRIANNDINLTGNIYAYDINETLINLYINIQKVPELVLLEVEKIINKSIIETSLEEISIINSNEIISNVKLTQSEYYYCCRNIFNTMTTTVKNSPIGSAYFIFLNKTCFRGLYREGPRGFNVPFGNYNNPEIINKKHILLISKLIKNVIFEHSSFQKSFQNISNLPYQLDNFIYLDPPYIPLNDNSFVNYTKVGFSMENHNLLFNLCKNISYKFILNNSYSDYIIRIFDDEKYKKEKLLCKRSINSKKPNSKINEILITNY